MVTSTERVVGQSLQRPDAPAKLTGRERYAGDLALAGLLHARLVLSSETHARITGIDGSAALATPGVVAVLTAADLPISATAGPPRARESLARGEVLYAGQPVAVVLAEDEAVAAEAAALVRVDYEPLPVVLDLQAAMAPGSPPVRLTSKAAEDEAEAAMHGVAAGGHVDPSAERLSSNVTNQTQMTVGDIADGFAQADVTVEGAFRTAWVHQSYLEPQTCVAAPDGLDGVVVYASTQGIFRTRTVVAQTLGLAQHQVRLVPMAVGGGFGGKFGLIEPLTAALALTARRPVRLAFSRSEEMVTANPTPAAIIELKVGARRDGTLTALQGRLVVDTGAFPGSPVGGMAFAICNCYRIPNIAVRGYEVMTNRLGPGAYRAPGNPQASFAVEQMIDALAERLGMDALALRIRNAPAEGDARPDGKPWPRIGLKECLAALQAHPLWQKRGTAGAGRFREGVGVGLGGWRGGLEPAAAQCQVDPEGTIVVVVGAVDLTGTHVVFQQIAAETIGVDIEHVRVVGADSGSAPYSGGAGGSKTVYTVGQAVQRAAEDAKQQILALAAQALEAAVEDLEISGDSVRVRGVPPSATSQITLKAIGGLTSGFGARNAPIAGRGLGAQTANAPGFAAHMARVRVDTETGQVDLLDYVATQDVGRAINPAAVAGQVIGAVAQGIGWGLYEQLLHDETGQVITGSLMDYALPRAHTVPAVETVLLEVPSPDGPFGARGVGEPPVIPVAAAIANAIHDATGVQVREMPVTAERLWQALNERG